MISRQSRSQAATEFLVIVGLAILIISVVIAFANSETGDILKTSHESEARTFVDKVSLAAKEVYGQGTGSRKQVFYTLPPSYDPNQSGVNGTMLRVRVGSTDVVSDTGFPVLGKFPGAAGSGTLQVENRGSYVLIGSSGIKVSIQQAVFFLLPGTNDTLSFDVTDTGLSTANISFSLSDMSPNANLSIQPSSDSLAPGASSSFDLSAIAGSTPGSYFGIMNVTGSLNEGNYSISVPISVDIGNYVEGFSISPPEVNLVMAAGTSQALNFTVCAPTTASYAQVNFSSFGDTGSWLWDKSAGYNLTAANFSPITGLVGDCKFKNVTIKVPADADWENYTGVLFASGSAADNDASLISVFVNQTAVTLGNISFAPDPIFVYHNVSFTVNATGGLANISACNITKNSNQSQVFRMANISGNLNKSASVLARGYINNFTTGLRNATIMCNDTAGHSSSPAVVQFAVYNSFAFITMSSTPSDTEDEWMEWLSDHSSALGLNWTYDNITATGVLSNLTNLSYYRSSIMAGYSTGIGLNNSIIGLINTNRSMIFLAGSTGPGSWELGISSTYGSDSSSGNTRIDIVNNSHYITAGYPLGMLKVASGMQESYLVNYDAKNLANATHGSSELGSVLWFNGTVFGWGLDEVGTSDGDTISIRVFDYALNSSWYMNSSSNPGSFRHP